MDSLKRTTHQSSRYIWHELDMRSVFVHFERAEMARELILFWILLAYASGDDFANDTKQGSLMPEDGPIVSSANRVCCGDLGCFDDNPPFSRQRLPECYDDNDVEYNLFTRSNRDTAARIRRHAAIPYQFSGTKRTIFVSHGWMSNSKYFHPVKDALLTKADVNVVLIDWPSDAYWYPQSAADTRTVGKLTSLIMKKLVEDGGASYQNMWCVGHSLGAHICGHAGRHTPYKIGRITGLDPAGPWFEGEDDITIGVNSADAQLVGIIHTDTSTYGTKRPLGHVDFYVNGLETEPDCNKRKRRKKRGMNTVGGFLGYLGYGACSHSRAPAYFYQSIVRGCFIARLECAGIRDMPDSCWSLRSPVVMGYGLDASTPHGIYYLATQKEKPYCKG